MSRRDTVTVRIPADLAATYTAHAKQLGVPMPWLVARVLRESADILRTELPLTLPLTRRDDGDAND